VKRICPGKTNLIVCTVLFTPQRDRTNHVLATDRSCKEEEDGRPGGWDCVCL